MCNEGEKDMLAEAKAEVVDKLQKYEIDNELIKALVTNKESIIVKNGVAQIDPSHPDYNFWMED